MNIKSNHILRFVFVAFCIATVIGCRGDGDREVAPKDIISINGETFTTKDLWDYASFTVLEIEPKDMENTAIKEELLNGFIEYTLLLQEATRREIKLDDTAVSQLSIQLSTSKGAKELRSITGKYEIDPETITKISSERLLIDALLRGIVDTAATISKEELEAYYAAKEYPKTAEGEAHINHIFTTDQAAAMAAEQELTEGILFSEIARKYSESPEKDSGGDLGFIKKDSYPEFFAAAFELKDGAVSPIIKSDYGYHIFKMVEHAKPDRNSYENMQKVLYAELDTIKRQESITEFANALYNNANIQYLNDFTLSDLYSFRSEQ